MYNTLTLLEHFVRCRNNIMVPYICSLLAAPWKRGAKEIQMRILFWCLVKVILTNVARRKGDEGYAKKLKQAGLFCISLFYDTVSIFGCIGSVIGRFNWKAFALIWELYRPLSAEIKMNRETNQETQWCGRDPNQTRSFCQSGPLVLCVTD